MFPPSIVLYNPLLPAINIKLSSSSEITIPSILLSCKKYITFHVLPPSSVLNISPRLLEKYTIFSLVGCIVIVNILLLEC